MSRSLLIPYIGLILCGAGGAVLNVLQLRMAKLGGVVMLYLGGSILLLSVCSFQMCAALFICGVGSAVLLATGSREGADQAVRNGQNRGVLVFRFLLALVLAVISYTASERLHFWIPVRRTVLFVCCWIMLMCLVSLSIEDLMLYRCMHLQAVCLSFTLCYIYMENSVLVFACFTSINLLLAFGSAVLCSDHLPAAGNSAKDNQ